MKVENGNKYGRLSEESLEKFEFLLGNKLPQEFRDHLLKYNGGDPSPGDFDISCEEGPTTLNGIYGLHDGPDHCSLLQTYHTYRGRIPRQLLAIGGDNFGNQICIGLIKKYTGRIYFWDHEKASKFFKFSATTLIAHSFSQFIKGLYEYIDPDESNIDRIIRLEDVKGMSKLIDRGFDIDTADENDSTPIELCTIHRKHTMLKYLFCKGAKLGSSLEHAEENAKYFKEHVETVNLIKELERGS